MSREPQTICENMKLPVASYMRTSSSCSVGRCQLALQLSVAYLVLQLSALREACYAQFLPIKLLSSAQKVASVLAMLNIMPITTAIMPQFIYNFIIFNN